MSRPCDTGMCDVRRCTDSDCLQPLSLYKGKRCNYLGEDMCPGIIGADGRCDYCGCDYIVLAKDEENARKKGEEQYVVEHTFNKPDKHERTNNTFINRYLENRKPRLPQELALLNRLADIETVRRLKEGLEKLKQ